MTKKAKKLTPEENIRMILTDAVTYRPDDLVMDDVKWRYLVRSVLRGKVTLLIGPSGCGKTKAAYSTQLAFPKRPFFAFNMGAGQDARGLLIGNTHYEEGTGTIVKESEFVRAIKTENAIVLLDEASRDLTGDTTNILMTVLDEFQRYLRIDEHPDAPVINVAKGVTFILTANQGNQYTTATVLDRALIGRCNSIIEMDPISQADEFDLLKRKYPSVTGDDLKILRAITEIAEATRIEVQSDTPEIETIIDTRQVENMLGMVTDGFSLEEIADACIYPLFPSEGGLDSPRTWVRQTIQKHIPTDLKNKKKPWGSGGSTTTPEPSSTAKPVNQAPWKGKA